MSRRRAKNSAPAAAEELVDVHCGCGWGRLQCPLSEAPAGCPLCGEAFDREIFVEGEFVQNPYVSEISDAGAALPDKGFLKTRGRGTFRVEPLAGYKAVRVSPYVHGVRQGDDETDLRATHIEVTDQLELSNNPRRIAHPRGDRQKPRRDWWKRRNAGHECPADGKDQRGRCVGLCGQCGEHGLTTGRYTSYCPSCQTCESCGCPEADGFSHYEGCRFAYPSDVVRLRDMPPPPHSPMTPNPRHDQFCPCVKCEIKKRHKTGCPCEKCKRGRHWSAQSGHYPGQKRCPKCEGPCGVKANPRKARRNEQSSGRKAVIVEVDIGLDDSIDDVLADPNVTDTQIDAALAGFDPSRTFAVRSDVEEILRRAGIKSVARSSEVEGTVVLAYAIPATHNPVVVAAALKKFFRGQKDVRVSVSK